ncbi:MAG: hypothetical protein HOH74_06245, partial [Gemmatimonadetes bacterium]|nr:hypothetical protein [Gemmatimonadota bacterium]
MKALNNIGLQESGRFGLRFLLILALCALLFEWFEGAIAVLHMLPVSIGAAALMRVARVEALLDTSTLGLGHCVIDVADVTYLVTHECTGIYALFLLVAAVLAYPASQGAVGRGLLLGIPALYAFGALRLFILGAVAQVRPDWIGLFHEYVMEVVSVAFVIYVW